MANKSQGKKQAKKKSSSKQEAKDRKKTERSYGDGMKYSRGQKQVINRKKHRGKAFKGTRKGQGK